MKKKFLLALMLALSTMLLFGCGKDDEEEDTENIVQDDSSVVADNPVVADQSMDDGLIDFDVDMGSNQSQQSNGGSTTNMLPQSATAKKFTGGTQSSGVHPDDVNQNNFHHIGKPVIKTSDMQNDGSKETNGDEEKGVSKEEENSVETETEKTSEKIELSAFYDDGEYVVGEDLEKDAIYIVLIDWNNSGHAELGFEAGDDTRYADVSEDAKAIYVDTSDNITNLTMVNCMAIYASDKSIKESIKDSLTSGVFLCGRDFEPGTYRFEQTGSNPYGLVYRTKDKEEELVPITLASIKYKLELNEGDYLYINSDFNVTPLEDKKEDSTNSEKSTND